MITKAITKQSLVLLDAQGKVMVSILKDRIKLWEEGFDARQESYQSVDAQQAKKLAIGLCDKNELKAGSAIMTTGILVAQEPAELFCKAMLAGKVADCRPYATGVALIGGENTLVCTDAYVLFKANVAHTSKETVIIPIRLIKALIKVAGKKGKISVFVEDDIITLKSNGFAAQSRSVQAAYPPVKQIYPQVTTEDTLIENLELEVKEKKVRSHLGTFYGVELVKKIKAMGFDSKFQIETVNRPALFRLRDAWNCEALLVPRF